MKKLLPLLVMVAPCFVSAGPGYADVLYNNPIANDANFDCSFNTTCATVASRGDDFAAQMFTLAEPSTITSASFSDHDGSGATPTSVNWIFLASDGAGGLPGTVLASGSSPILGQMYLGQDFGGDLALDQYYFDVTSLGLGAGSYYFAVQAVTTNFANYLSEGVAGSGAAETADGGTTWSVSYEGLPSIAVGLNGEIPEPASLALFGVGLAGIGGVRRRRGVH